MKKYAVIFLLSFSFLVTSCNKPKTETALDGCNNNICSFTPSEISNKNFSLKTNNEFLEDNHEKKYDTVSDEELIEILSK